MQDLSDDYADVLSGSADQYEVDMTSPRATHDSAVQSADDIYDGLVSGFQDTRTAAEQDANDVFADAEQSAADAYGDAEDDYWDSCDLMSMTCDETILNQAAKDYEVAVAGANVTLVGALGDAAIAFVSSERPADTTRVRAINQADHTLSVADANVSHDQTIRDLGALETYVKDSTERQGQYDIDVETKHKDYEKDAADAKRTLALATHTAQETFDHASIQASHDLAYAQAAAWEAYANGVAPLEEQRAVAAAVADKTLANDLATADAALWNAEALASNTLAKAFSTAYVDLVSDMASEEQAFVSTMAGAVTAWTATVAPAQAFAFATQHPGDPNAVSVAGAWIQYQNAQAAASSMAMTSETALWTSYTNSVAAAEKAASDDTADAELARTQQLIGDYQDNVSDVAEAERIADVAIAGDAKTAAIAMNAADRAYDEAYADAAQVYDDAMATASHQANDAWAQAVRTYIVNALPLELTAFTDSTNALVDATKDMTTDLTQALRDTAGAERTQHVAELDAALTAANGKAVLDDPIAIAATQNDKAQSVLAAQQELADLQAEPIDAFVDAGPNGGGFFAGVGDVFTGIANDIGDWISGVASWLWEYPGEFIWNLPNNLMGFAISQVVVGSSILPQIVDMFWPGDIFEFPNFYWYEGMILVEGGTWDWLPSDGAMTIGNFVFGPSDLTQSPRWVHHEALGHGN